MKKIAVLFVEWLIGEQYKLTLTENLDYEDLFDDFLIDFNNDQKKFKKNDETDRKRDY